MKTSDIKKHKYYCKKYNLSSLQRLLLYFSIVILTTIESSCLNKKIEKLSNLIPLVSQQSATIQDGCYHDIFIIHDSLLVLICNPPGTSIFSTRFSQPNFVSKKR